MSPVPKLRGGRPRGSGKTEQIPAIDLKQDEASCFRVGKRIYELDETAWNPIVPSMEAVSRYLTPAERSVLLRMGERNFKAWVDIGGVWAGMTEAIEMVRSR